MACAAFLTAAPTLAGAPTPADHLANAQAALADGMYPSAEQHLVKFLALNRASAKVPESATALALLCQAYAGQGRHADIPGLLDNNADIVAHGDPRVFDYWRANALVESGDITNALKRLDPDTRLAAQTNDIANLRLLHLAADALFRLGDADSSTRAEELVDFLLRTAPQTAPSLPLAGVKLLKARLLARRGDAATAATAFAALADDETNATFVRARALLELVGLSEANAPAALDFANRLARLPLGKAASDYVIPCGRILASRRGTVEAGARYLARAVHDNPASPLAPDAQFAIARAWLSANSNALAAAEFKNYLETYGATPGQTILAAAGRAEALYRLGDFSESATLFQKAAQTSTNAIGRAILDMRAADALHADGKYETAAALYGDISRRSHGSSGFENAIRLMRILYPNATPGKELPFLFGRSSFMEADSLERCGRPDEALARFTSLADGVGSAPFADEALYRTALLLERQGAGIGSTKEAIAHYAKLISATTDDALRCKAHLGRGRCYYRTKSFENAIDEFEEAERSGVESADEAQLYHVYALYAIGDNKEAVARAEAFIRRGADSPALPTLSLWLAQYVYTALDFKASAKRFADFAEKWPDDPRAPRAMLWSAKADLRQGENQEALKTLAALGNRYGASDVIPEARFTQAKALCNLARFEEAVTVIDSATANFPDSAFTTRALILKGDAIFSLFGTEKSVYSVTNALTAYEIAGNRPDATAETRLECNYKSARCLEKGGDAASVAKLYYDNVITPFYALADKGTVSPQGVSFYERAAFACARLREQAGEIEGALEILRRIKEYDTPDRAQAEREIERIENGKE